VTDNNVPPLSDEKTFHVQVLLNLPPQVIARQINNGQVQRSRLSQIAVQFSEDVGASLSVADMQLVNLTTGAAINSATMSLTYMVQLTALSSPSLACPGASHRRQLSPDRFRRCRHRHARARRCLTTLSSPSRAHRRRQWQRVVNDIDLYGVWQELLKAPASRDLNADLDGEGL